MSVPMLFCVRGGALPHLISARTYAHSDTLDSIKTSLEAEGLDPAQYEIRSGGGVSAQADYWLEAISKVRTGTDPTESDAAVWAVHHLLLRLRRLTADAGEAAGLAGAAAAQWRQWMSMLGKAEWALDEGDEGDDEEGDTLTVNELLGRVMLLCADLYAATGLEHFLREVERWMLWRRLLRGDLRARWGL